MKEKALLLIGLYSKKWLAEKIGINFLTLDKRLKTDYWKISEISRLNEVYESEKINL